MAFNLQKFTCLQFVSYEKFKILDVILTVYASDSQRAQNMPTWSLRSCREILENLKALENFILKFKILDLLKVFE